MGNYTYGHFVRWQCSQLSTRYVYYAGILNTSDFRFVLGYQLLNEIATPGDMIVNVIDLSDMSFMIYTKLTITQIQAHSAEHRFLTNH